MGRGPGKRRRVDHFGRPEGGSVWAPIDSHGEEVVARHERLVGRRQRTVNPEHWAGLSRRARAATEEGPAPAEGRMMLGITTAPCARLRATGGPT